DKLVTGVQTCALPISLAIPPACSIPAKSFHSAKAAAKSASALSPLLARARHDLVLFVSSHRSARLLFSFAMVLLSLLFLCVSLRSEERRVGKECSSRW